MNANTILVSAAVGIAAVGTILTKTILVNNTIYGYSSNGLCVVASSSLAPGCAISGTGSACQVLIYPSGAPAQYADAYKSPTSGAICMYPIKRTF